MAIFPPGKRCRSSLAQATRASGVCSRVLRSILSLPAAAKLTALTSMKVCPARVLQNRLKSPTFWGAWLGICQARLRGLGRPVYGTRVGQRMGGRCRTVEPSSRLCRVKFDFTDSAESMDDGALCRLARGDCHGATVLCRLVEPSFRQGDFRPGRVDARLLSRRPTRGSARSVHGGRIYQLSMLGRGAVCDFRGDSH